MARGRNRQGNSRVRRIRRQVRTVNWPFERLFGISGDLKRGCGGHRHRRAVPRSWRGTGVPWPLIRMRQGDRQLDEHGLREDRTRGAGRFERRCSDAGRTPCRHVRYAAARTAGGWGGVDEDSVRRKEVLRQLDLEVMTLQLCQDRLVAPLPQQFGCRAAPGHARETSPVGRYLIDKNRRLHRQLDSCQLQPFEKLWRIQRKIELAGPRVRASSDERQRGEPRAKSLPQEPGDCHRW